MRHEKQTNRDFYPDSETGEIFCIEKSWDGVVNGSWVLALTASK